ncbi:Ig-like domain-containing protein, partial [bacterium]|nr:Ig-like domain-containing protein [bacterium]
LTDDLGGQQNQPITLTIHPVNDPAVISGNIHGAGDENTILGGSLQATDPDGLTDGTLFTITGDPAHGTAAIDPAAGDWSYTPNLDFHGQDAFEVTLTDDLGGQQNQPITFTIYEVNDPPVITKSPATHYIGYGFGESVSIADTSLSISDVDDIFLKSATISLEGNGNGSIYFNPPVPPYGDMMTFTGNVLAPAVTGSVDTPGVAYGVAFFADGTTTYVADGFSGLTVIDFSIPASPNILGSVGTPGDALGVALSSDGETAYVACGWSGLRVMNVSDLANPEILGSVDAPGSARGVALSSDGTTAYVAYQEGFSRRLTVINIRNLADPEILGSVDTPGDPGGVTLSSDGTTAYVADGIDGLTVIDVSDPTAPAILGSIDTPGSARGVAFSADGTTAYVADGRAGLTVIDVLDLANPEILGSVDTPGHAHGVALSSDGTTAFVADGSSDLGSGASQSPPTSGLTVIDIRPGFISRTDHFNPPFSSRDSYELTLSGRATPAQYQRALQSLRYHRHLPLWNGYTGVTEESTFSELSQLDRYDYNSGDFTVSIVVEDDRGAYSIPLTSTIHVDDPAVITGDIHGAGDEDTILGGTLQATDPEGLTDGTLFTITEQAAHGTAVIDPASGAWSYTPNNHFHGRDAFEVTLTDDLGGKTKGLLPLTIHPVNDPAVISGAGGTREYPTGESIPVVDTTLDIGDVDDIYLESATLSLSDNGVPSGDVLTFTGVGPAILGSVDTPGSAHGVTLSSDGETAYVADGSAGLTFIDVSVPASPFILGSLDTPGDANEVVLSSDGTTAYVADLNAGLQVINVHDPAGPFILGSVDTPGDAYGVAFFADGTTAYAYVADGPAGLQVINVHDPATLSILGSVDTPGDARGVALSSDGTTAFVADKNYNLQVIDVRDP